MPGFHFRHGRGRYLIEIGELATDLLDVYCVAQIGVHLLLQHRDVVGVLLLECSRDLVAHDEPPVCVELAINKPATHLGDRTRNRATRRRFVDRFYPRDVRASDLLSVSTGRPKPLPRAVLAASYAT